MKKRKSRVRRQKLGNFRLNLCMDEFEIVYVVANESVEEASEWAEVKA